MPWMRGSFRVHRKYRKAAKVKNVDAAVRRPGWGTEPILAPFLFFSKKGHFFNASSGRSLQNSQKAGLSANFGPANPQTRAPPYYAKIAGFYYGKPLGAIQDPIGD